MSITKTLSAFATSSNSLSENLQRLHAIRAGNFCHGRRHLRREGRTNAYHVYGDQVFPPGSKFSPEETSVGGLPATTALIIPC